MTSFSSAGRPITTGTGPSSSSSWSGTPPLIFFSSQRGLVMASVSRITWLTSIGTKGSSCWRIRANFCMRRTVSAPPVAAFSITSMPRLTTSTLPGLRAMSWA